MQLALGGSPWNLLWQWWSSTSGLNTPTHGGNGAATAADVLDKSQDSSNSGASDMWWFAAPLAAKALASAKPFITNTLWESLR